MKKVFLLLMLSATLFSCSDDEPQSFDSSPYLVGFNKASDVKSYTATGEVIPLNVPVVLLGGMTGLPVGSDVTVTYSVDPASTATQGDEFDFVGGSNTAVIPAGGTFANIPISINTGNLETGSENAKTLILNIVSAVSDHNVVVAQQYSQMMITINGLCFSNAQGMYHLTVTRMDTGTVYDLPGEEIFALADAGNYLTNSTGPYNTRGLISAGAQLASDTPGFVFTEVCGDITMQTQQLAGVYSNIVTQSAAQAANSHIDEAGVITIEYSVWFTGNTVERPYRGVYVPE